MEMLDIAAVNYQIILTKTDKIKPTALNWLLGDTATRISQKTSGSS